MAANRRRRSATTKSRSGSTPPRKRRSVQKSAPKPANKRKPAAKQVKKKKVKRKTGTPVNWKSRLQKGAIALFFVADVVLIYFFIKHCANRNVETPPPPEPVPVQNQVEKVLQIEVLNGCGVSGIAAKFTEFLRDAGFDVVKTDNYKENDRDKFNMPRTVVIDRRGVKENALKVGRALGLSASRVLSEPNEAYLIDATAPPANFGVRRSC